MTNRRDGDEQMDEWEKPVIIDPPKSIWLVYGDTDESVHHRDCHGAALWCEDNQFESDVPYIRAREEDIVAWMYFVDAPRHKGVVINKKDIDPAVPTENLIWEPLYGRCRPSTGIDRARLR